MIDLIKERLAIDVITKSCPLCFQMAERFENSDNILCHLVEKKVQKSLVHALSRCEKQEEEMKKRFSFRK